MYICNDCERTFDEPVTWQESRGEFWGSPCYETLSGCPYCYSCGYEEYNESEEFENDG